MKPTPDERGLHFGHQFNHAYVEVIRRKRLDNYIQRERERDILI